MGSLALSLCHLAAGRVDGVCSLKNARAVDIAAAQLLVRERGLAIDLPSARPFDAAPLDTTGRSRVVAAATPATPVDRLPEPTQPAEDEGDAVGAGQSTSAPEPGDADTPDPAGADSPAQLSLF